MANPSENSATKEGSKLTKFLKNLISPTHYRRFRRQEELLKETRTVMLVAVTLVAAVTFQSGVNPPGGVWQDTVNCTICKNCTSCPDGAEEHFAGQAIYSSQPVPFYFFLSCNTLAFSSSVYLLLSLTFGYPFFLEVFVATLSMSGTYIAAIFAVTPSENKPYSLITLVAVLPFILRPAICLLSGMFRKEKRLPENETISEF